MRSSYLPPGKNANLRTFPCQTFLLKCFISCRGSPRLTVSLSRFNFWLCSSVCVCVCVCVRSALPGQWRLCLHIMVCIIRSDSVPASLFTPAEPLEIPWSRAPLSHTSHFLFLSAVQAKQIRLRYLRVIAIMILNKTYNRIFIEFSS